MTIGRARHDTPGQSDVARRRGRFLAAVVVLAGVFVGGGRQAQGQPVRPRVIASFPHDRQAFTQGLLLFEGKLFESTGLLGQSSLRRVDKTTGVVEQRAPLEATLFGEGLERIDRKLIQLTWRNGVAIIYDLDTFVELQRLAYQGEGWGLCDDGQRLVMSDGSSVLTFRDRSTFEPLGQVEVQMGGRPIRNLNELACVGELVYANVWQTNTILRIDGATGQVLTEVDASGLLTAAEGEGADVLNGIAYDPVSRHFYLTGKLWPKLFEVAFEFEPDRAPHASADAGVDGSTDGGIADGRTTDAPADSNPTPGPGGGCACGVGPPSSAAGSSAPAWGAPLVGFLSGAMIVCGRVPRRGRMRRGDR